MKRFLSLILIASLIAPGFLRADGMDHPVKVILLDGSVVKGDLLGSDDKTLTLQLASGKSKDIPLASVKKAFDAASGKPLDLAAGASAAPAAAPAAAATAAASDSEDEDSVPAKHARKPARAAHRTNGRKVAGDITAAVGGVFVVVGLCAGLYGSSQENDATSTYCKGYQCSGQDYSPYTLPGKPGYYTYSQYTEYYYGQDWLDTGLVVGGLGLVACITGAIIASTGRNVEEDALLHYEDGQLALGVPALSLDPRLHYGPSATLGVVRF